MKKNWLSRVLAVMLTGAMTIGLLTGCGQQEQKESSQSSVSSQLTQSKETGQSQTQESTNEVVEPEGVTYPLEEDVELSIFIYNGIPVADAYADASQSPFHTGLAERVGVDVDWQFPAKGTDIQVALNLLWQEKELPNIIFGTCSSVTNALEWYNDGVIYDLTDYLPVYAPDYWEYINRPENKEDARQLASDDGRYFAIYGFSESDYNFTYVGPVIRQDWLDECGLEAPETLEEWEKVLVKFKEKYNATFGFPLGRYDVGGGISSGTGAQAPFYPRYYLDENNQVQYGNAQEEWKEMLEVFNRWYEMGLIDPDFATCDDATIRAKALSGEIGVSYTAMSQMTNWAVDAEAEKTGAEWVGFSHPTTASGEPVVYHYTKRSRAGSYGGVITKDSTEEELIAALKFLNYGYTEEGLMYHNFGEEGVTYTVDANGDVHWTELVTKDEGGINTAVKKYTGTHTGCMSIQLSDFVRLKNSEAAGQAVYEWVKNSEARNYTMPVVTLTEEEKANYTDLNTALNTYVHEMALKFATGEESLDNFDDYVTVLYEMGLQECLDIQQAAVDRYLNK